MNFVKFFHDEIYPDLDDRPEVDVTSVAVYESIFLPINEEHHKLYQGLAYFLELFREIFQIFSPLSVGGQFIFNHLEIERLGV